MNLIWYIIRFVFDTFEFLHDVSIQSSYLS